MQSGLREGLPGRDHSPSFRERVDSFWEWFAAVAPQFYEEIESGNCAALEPAVSRVVGTHLPSFSWAFGPGEHAGHSLTLSASGNLHRQFLAEYWRERAPMIDGWTFHASRQPTQLDDLEIGIAGRQVAAADLMIAPTVDEEANMIDIVAWHPSFESLDEDFQYTVVFLYLDEALGEFGTQSWIGGIDLRAHTGEAIPVTQMKPFVDRVVEQRDWNRNSPLESYSTYRMPEPSSGFLRADTLIGTTSNMSLIHDYFDADGDMENPLDGLGAEFIFLTLPSDIFPEGEQVEVRGRFEDDLDERLRAASCGRHIGGAFGLGGGYIDLLFFDLDAAHEIVAAYLKEQGLAERAQLHLFARQ
ncbi:MAG: hypothetical protein QGG36_21730 [Pirellulaceae bacterium]|jgi:hypothetical protein|nr:hypothetical protein [Pirellulaceae bacterium]MDP7018441.1 hypothetical protein [Pirellulaceae bacterium]